MITTKWHESVIQYEITIITDFEYGSLHNLYVEFMKPVTKVRFSRDIADVHFVVVVVIAELVRTDHEPQ